MPIKSHLHSLHTRLIYEGSFQEKVSLRLKTIWPGCPGSVQNMWPACCPRSPSTRSLLCDELAFASLPPTSWPLADGSPLISLYPGYLSSLGDPNPVWVGSVLVVFFLITLCLFLHWRSLCSHPFMSHTGWEFWCKGDLGWVDSYRDCKWDQGVSMQCGVHRSRHSSSQPLEGIQTILLSSRSLFCLIRTLQTLTCIIISKCIKNKYSCR